LKGILYQGEGKNQIILKEGKGATLATRPEGKRLHPHVRGAPKKKKRKGKEDGSCKNIPAINQKKKKGITGRKTIWECFSFSRPSPKKNPLSGGALSRDSSDKKSFFS